MKHETTQHFAAELKAGVRYVTQIGIVIVDEILVCRECAGKPCTVMGLNQTLFAAAKATQKLMVTNAFVDIFCAIPRADADMIIDLD